MSQTTDNILYIPIQINGDTAVPTDLLERELYIKDKILYVGPGSSNSKDNIIIGRVVDNATIKNPTLHSPTIKDKLIILGEGLVVETETDIKSPHDGQVVFVIDD